MLLRQTRLKPTARLMMLTQSSTVLMKMAKTSMMKLLKAWTSWAIPPSIYVMQMVT